MERTEIRKIAKIIAEELQVAAIWNKWLTLKEACQYAKVSPNTIRRWIDEGLIYATKTTGAWRIDRESIDDFFNLERA